jgi:uncharacterized protein
MNGLILSQLYIYPIKALKGIAVDAAMVEERGLQYDRRWMLIDDNNRFISQREAPQLATVAVKLRSDGLEISSNGGSPLLVPFVCDGEGSEPVTIWASTVPAEIVGEEASNWFSNLLGTACRLVQMPDETRRQVNPQYAVRSDDVVSFADGYPFLVATESSLDDLNSRLAEPLKMNRFRPNFVVKGGQGFAEDNWKQISIGETSFHVVKPSERCVVTTVDQERGERAGQEPLRTLATFRQRNNAVHFGQNLIAANVGGQIKVGDVVTIVKAD